MAAHSDDPFADPLGFETDDLDSLPGSIDDFRAEDFDIVGGSEFEDITEKLSQTNNSMLGHLVDLDPQQKMLVESATRVAQDSDPMLTFGIFAKAIQSARGQDFKSSMLIEPAVKAADKVSEIYNLGEGTDFVMGYLQYARQRFGTGFDGMKLLNKESFTDFVATRVAPDEVADLVTLFEQTFRMQLQTDAASLLPNKNS
jgi:hypothetical protein